ncbi:hypothetical protein ASF08_21175 [Methylobacterium sp. Leaf85]|nr:hypothetical protein ASF08_21175 [Methylobacterium sp. Leaf85]
MRWPRSLRESDCPVGRAPWGCHGVLLGRMALRRVRAFGRMAGLVACVRRAITAASRGAVSARVRNT